MASSTGKHLDQGVAVGWCPVPRPSRLLVATFTGLVALSALAAAGCAQEVTDLGPGTSPGPPGEAPDTGPSGEAAIARDLFDRLNDERVGRDLEPLAWDDQLADLAQEWSEEMARTGTPEHRDIDQEVIVDRLDGFEAVGENIFSATGPVPAGYGHVGWMQSPGHRRNLLEPGWDRVGIGVRCTPEGEMYVTQNFGRTTETDAPPLEMGDPPEEPIVRPERDGPTC